MPAPTAPEPSCPLVIAMNLHDDAAALIEELSLGNAPRGRVLVGRDGPDDIRDMSAPEAHVTPAAWAGSPGEVQDLVDALRFGNPGISVHWPAEYWQQTLRTPDGWPTQSGTGWNAGWNVTRPDGRVTVPDFFDQATVAEQNDADTDLVRADGLTHRILAGIRDRADATFVFLERVPAARRQRASREAARRRLRTGMSVPDAFRSVADDYATGRLS